MLKVQSSVQYVVDYVVWSILMQRFILMLLATAGELQTTLRKTRRTGLFYDLLSE